MKEENQVPEKEFNASAFVELIKKVFKHRDINQVISDNAKAFIEVMGSENLHDANERQIFMESHFTITMILKAIKDKGSLKPESCLEAYYDMV